MKQTLKTLIRNVKSIKGNSLAEFATTTALMATLAATAAPKLSEMSEGAKSEKSRNEIDKLIKQGGQFYQDKAAAAPDGEGRGRFPGQSKFNVSVGSGSAGAYDNTDATTSGTSTAQGHSDAHTYDILTDLGVIRNDGTKTDGWRQYDDAPVCTWVSVFGRSNADNPVPGAAAPNMVDSGTTDDDGNAIMTSDGSRIIDNSLGTADWKNLMGDDVLASTFQDGHYVYSVVAGGGSGMDVYPPTLYVADIENATDFNNLLEP